MQQPLLALPLKHSVPFLCSRDAEGALEQGSKRHGASVPAFVHAVRPCRPGFMVYAAWRLAKKYTESTGSNVTIIEPVSASKVSEPPAIYEPFLLSHPSVFFTGS